MVATVAVDADALILGGGCAGLSLAVQIVDAARRRGRGCPRVVIVEPRTHYVRDRTWCGWHLDDHPFAAAVDRRWTRWAVADDRRRVVRGTAEYAYEHVPADAFYAVARDRLAGVPQVALQLGVQATAVDDQGSAVEVATTQGSLRASVVFDTRPPPSQPLASRVDEVDLIQHFVGWEVEAPRPCFDPEVVELMDFAVDQTAGLHFLYVLPQTSTRALVETTYMSPSTLPAAHYDADLRGYLGERYGLAEFAVTFTESGQIPMSTRPARLQSSPRVVQLGLRGGAAKPSTGYAFAAIQRQAAVLAERFVAAPGRPVAPVAPRPATSVAMDRVFLSVLARHPARAPALFVDLFESLPPALLCRFLCDRASAVDSLRVMASTPLATMTAEVLRSHRRWLRPAVQT